MTEQDISRWIDLLGICVVVAGVLGGVIAGKVRQDLRRCLVLGLMIGALGPAMSLAWHVVDARTSYWDYIYRDTNPERARALWPVVGAGKLDSVSNLLGLAAAFAIAGVAGGLLYARIACRLGLVDSKPGTAVPEHDPAVINSPAAAASGAPGQASQETESGGERHET